MVRINKEPNHEVRVGRQEQKCLRHHSQKHEKSLLISTHYLLNNMKLESNTQIAKHAGQVPGPPLLHSSADKALDFGAQGGGSPYNGGIIQDHYPLYTAPIIDISIIQHHAARYNIYTDARPY